MNHLSLFSGIGGLDLAAEMAGFQTVGQCEWADYPTKVLEKHWPDVPRWRDIRTLTGESFYEKTGLRTVDVVSGGFPCQPFSVAGKRRGKEDDRYLWPEMLRVIRELRPAWVVGENVAGIISLALDQVLADLEGEGYACRTFVFPAVALDTPHRRDRCAIVAHTKGPGLQGRLICTAQQEEKRVEGHAGAEGCKAVADVDNRSWDVRRVGELQTAETHGGTRDNHAGGTPEHGSRERRATQPRLGGMADGISAWLDRGMSAPGHWLPEPDVPRITTRKEHRADRLRALGNAVVPQQFYPVFSAIAGIEEGENHG